MPLLSFARKLTGRAESKPKPKTKKKVGVAGSAAPKQAGEAAGAKAGQSAKEPDSTLAESTIPLEPYLTEKSVNQHASLRTVTFKVQATATKHEVARAFEAKYSFSPTAVRSIRMSGKSRRRGHSLGKTAQWKKVYVTMPEGKSIDFTV